MKMKQIIVFIGCCHAAAAFAPFVGGRVNVQQTLDSHACFSDAGGDVITHTTRRVFVDDTIKGSLGIFIASTVASTPAYASGGATAGGAYLLSAKQRYNKRVIAGVKSLLSLDARDLSQVEEFFSSHEEGGWEDLSAAGYLLANAFRTSSTKAPDSLPSVKKWRAFAKEMELVQRSLSKKDGEKTFASYKNAEEKLDAYLEAVELPPGMELKQM
mmetsp:Transcript_13458/g.26391  ORF Transcript_13458/g.26391 Transcript_13458/m.26391 type:complete len:214 (+) Transcript_13458:61-702(+)